jgi:L-lactate dehydrogenase complex protein LldG
MSSSAKSDIFAKLEKAASPLSSNEILRESWALGEPPHPTLPADNTIEAFLINVLKNRGTLDCVSNRSEAVKAISQFLYKNYHTQRLVVSNDSRLAAMPWRDGGLLPRFGQVEPGEPVALGFAKLAIAELGAIVTFTGKANPAENNLLPEHHLVIVNAEDIVANSEQAWDRIQQETATTGAPRGINFIAGPSSTADIEGRLVYGAHGPRGWHVIVMGDIPESAMERALSEVGDT